MATEVITGTLVEMSAIVDADSARDGCPRKGTNVGAGPHITIAETPGLGWTMRRVEPFLYDGDQALDVDADLEKTGQQHAPTAAKLATKKVKDKDKVGKDKAKAFSGEFDGTFS